MPHDPLLINSQEAFEKVMKLTEQVDKKPQIDNEDDELLLAKLTANDAFRKSSLTRAFRGKM